MKKLTSAVLFCSLVATLAALAGCATPDAGGGGGSTASTEKDREPVTGTRVPGRY